MFCQNKFSKFTTINVSPFQTRRADFWLFLARIKEMFFLKTQVCKARSRTNHNKDNAHKFCQICLFNRTNCIECKLYTKLNINCCKWIIELNLKVLLLLAFLSWGRWAFCWLDYSANLLNSIPTSWRYWSARIKNITKIKKSS